MTDEQRAHEFAIEIIKMYFEVNKDQFETVSEKQTIVPVKDLHDIYNAAYELVIKG